MIYTVFWVSQIEAETPLQAADEAWTNIVNGALVFDVTPGTISYPEYKPANAIEIDMNEEILKDSYEYFKSQS